MFRTLLIEYMQRADLPAVDILWLTGLPVDLVTLFIERSDVV